MIEKIMIREDLQKRLSKIVGQDVTLEHPSDLKHGDYSTNIALKTKSNAQDLVVQFEKSKELSKMIESISVAEPGFINFTLSKSCLEEELSFILEKESQYGSLNIGKGKKIQIEFISANPTGPLTVANARGGPLGDVLANVLKKAGYTVEKAFYVNNYGNQIKVLGHSVLKDEESKYQGEYIDALHEAIQGENDPYKVGSMAAEKILETIKKTTDNLQIKYDEWIFEKDIADEGYVDKILKLLEKNNLLYDKEEAVWFKSTQYGDNRDRVLVKKDKNRTYLAGDIALHYYKFKEKKFDKVINIWGADHHGDVPGLMAGVDAIGEKGKLDIILMQFVTLVEGGATKRMSKRAGNYVTMDELLNDVGSDAVRFFFLRKASNTHFKFDLDLAREKSSSNPLFYVQYAHARICSILEKAKDYNISGINIDKLSHPSEMALIRVLIRYQEIIEDICGDNQVHILPYFALDIAHSFHKFYEECRVIDEKEEITYARLALTTCCKIILKDVLDLMSIKAPDKM